MIISVDLKIITLANRLLANIILGNNEYCLKCKNMNLTDENSVKFIVCILINAYVNEYYPDEKFIWGQAISSPEVYNLARTAINNELDFQSLALIVSNHCNQYKKIKSL